MRGNCVQEMRGSRDRGIGLPWPSGGAGGCFAAAGRGSMCRKLAGNSGNVFCACGCRSPCMCFASPAEKRRLLNLCVRLLHSARKLVGARCPFAFSVGHAYYSPAFFLYFGNGHAVNKAGDCLQVAVAAFLECHIAYGVPVDIKADFRCAYSLRRVCAAHIVLPFYETSANFAFAEAFGALRATN